MKRSELLFAVLLVPLDYITLIAAGIAAYYSRFLPQLTAIRPVTFDLGIEEYTNIVIFVAVIWVVVFAMSGLYKIQPRKLTVEVSRIIVASAAGVAAVFALLFFTREAFESRFILLAAWLLVILLVSTERIIIRLIQRSIRRLGVGLHKVVVIGKGKTADALMKEFKAKRSLGFITVANYDKFNDEIAKKISRLKKKDGVDEIIITDPETTRDMRQKILNFADAEHINFKHTADVFDSASTRFEAHTMAGVPIIEFKSTPLEGWGAVYKRLFDIVISFLLILITLPLQALVALALFIEQPGRILFSRTPDNKKTMRIGLDGKPFHYFKFRSMVKDAHKYRFDKDFIKKYGNERGGTPLFKLKDDPRITRVGKFIRKYSIDEIPEFYLVLIGRMSLVGPRPHLPEEVDKYQPHHRRVHAVKPGITGLAQISGRADLDFEEEIRLDVYYIENWTPFLDIIILIKTPLVVFWKKGAY